MGYRLHLLLDKADRGDFREDILRFLVNLPLVDSARHLCSMGRPSLASDPSTRRSS